MSIYSQEYSFRFFNSAIEIQQFWLGKGHWDRIEQFFMGSIEELKIFNKALTVNGVKELFNEPNVTTN